VGDARTNKGEAGKEEGGRRGEVGEEEAELGPSNQREKELGSKIDKRWGWVSIPAIMPGPHAHMAPYARDQPRRSAGREPEQLAAAAHHKSFRDKPRGTTYTA